MWLGGCAAALASQAKELAVREAERNKLRSEAAAAGRTVSKLTAQLAAMPKARPASAFVKLKVFR